MFTLALSLLCGLRIVSALSHGFITCVSYCHVKGPLMTQPKPSMGHRHRRLWIQRHWKWSILLVTPVIVRAAVWGCFCYSFTLHITVVAETCRWTRVGRRLCLIWQFQRFNITWLRDSLNLYRSSTLYHRFCMSLSSFWSTTPCSD